MTKQPELPSVLYFYLYRFYFTYIKGCKSMKAGLFHKNSIYLNMADTKQCNYKRRCPCRAQILPKNASKME